MEVGIAFNDDIISVDEIILEASECRSSEPPKTSLEDRSSSVTGRYEPPRIKDYVETYQTIHENQFPSHPEAAGLYW